MSKVRTIRKAFVTGADGFIGSHLVEQLLGQGIEVTALCIYNSMGQYGWLDHYRQEAPKNLKLILGDVRDSGFMESAVRGHDTVFHLASLIAIPYSYAAPQSYFDTNVNGALNVAQACLKHQVERLGHTSTSEVYGTAQLVPISETHPLVGQSPYSASKIGADMLIESFVRSFKLQATTLRPFNTFGPRQSSRAVIPTIINQILAGAREIQLGALKPTRDFNYVKNTVDAFMTLAAAKDSVVGQTYNAGSGREISIEDTVRMISELCKSSVSVVQSEERLRPANSEVERLLCDSSKLMAITDWRPHVSLEDGIQRTIDWQRRFGADASAARYQI